jgi:excisionase family DNA binding protein
LTSRVHGGIGIFLPKRQNPTGCGGQSWPQVALFGWLFRPHPCGTHVAITLFKSCLGNRRNQLSRSEKGSVQMFKNDGSHVLTVKELSDYLKVHPSTIYRQLKRGRLPAFKVGSDWRFNIESIDSWRLEQDGFKAA